MNQTLPTLLRNVALAPDSGTEGTEKPRTPVPASLIAKGSNTNDENADKLQFPVVSIFSFFLCGCLIFRLFAVEVELNTPSLI